MLNFINNKFRKIFLLKTVVLSNLVCDIFCGCLIGEKNDTEIRGKKNAGCCGGICGNDDSDIDTDTSTDGESNISGDNGGNGGGNSNNNDKNLIESKKKILLIKLDEIIKDNDCLVDKIAEQVIKDLEKEIENINSVDTSNIENELKDLRSTIDSKLDEIKKNYRDTVTNIINSIEILKNCYKEKYKSPKYTLNIDDIYNTKFAGIKDLNNKLDEIQKNYKDSINEIVLELKTKFDILKKEKSNIKDIKLDVKDDDFNDLTEVTKIIDIDRKLFIYDSILKGNKEAIIDKINQINEKLEKHSKLLTTEFKKETNLNDKNIEELITIYNKQLDIYINLLIKFSKYKEKQQDKYKELNDVYTTFHDKLNFDFPKLEINFINYDLDNYEYFDKQINEFENNLNDFIITIKNEYEKKINELKDIYKEKGVKKEININIEINNNDKLEEKYNKLNQINEEIQKNEKTLKYIVTEPLNKDEMEKIFNKVSKTKENIYIAPVYTYNSDEYNNNNNIIYTENNNIENDVLALLNRLNDIDLNYNISFIIKGNNVSDYGGVRRQKFEEMTNYILNNKKINSSFYDIDNETPEIGNCNLFNQIEGYSIGSEKDNYNNFGLICGSQNNEHILYYKLLAYLCANSLRNNSTLKINFNPLIYKIMLNFDFTCNLNDKKIVCDNLKKFITYDDLKYFSTGTYEYLKTNFDDEDLFENFDGAYKKMINHFSYQIEGIKTFYENLIHYLNRYSFSKKFEKDEFWNLKLFIEGKSKITPNDIISIIDEKKIMKTKKNGNNETIINDHNAKIIIDCFKEILKEFKEEEIKDFLRWISGSTSLPSEIYFQFTKTVDYSKNESFIMCHSCHSYFDLSLEYLSKCIDNKNGFNFIDKKLTEDQENIIKETFKKYLTGVIAGSNFNQI